MDFFGRRSPPPAATDDIPGLVGLDRDKRHSYEKLHGVFSEQAHLVENFATQLEAYELSLRQTKKCLHGLTETMSDLYHNAGPNSKEFRVALEDEERLMEDRAHAIHNIIQEDVARFRKIHAHGKQLIDEREAQNKKTKQAIDGLRRLYHAGKGGDRRVPKIAAEVSQMVQALEDANDLAVRDLPLAILSRGSFISETFPKYFNCSKEFCEDTLQITETLCGIVEELKGIHVGSDKTTADAFDAISRSDRRKFLQKYKMIPDDEDFEPSDDEDEELSAIHQTRVSMSYPSEGPTRDQSRVTKFTASQGGTRSLSPSPDRGGRPQQQMAAPAGRTWQRASSPSGGEERQGSRSGSPRQPFNQATTRLFDRDGRILI